MNTQHLAPADWNEFIGQEDIKQHVRIVIDAALGREQSPEHMLFYGPPGLGKTTLANLIATDLGVPITVTSGPAIERVGDMASILTNIQPGGVVFIDEIHRLNRSIEEALYPAMERGVLDIILGKGPSARSVQLELPPFMMIAATTRLALLSQPLRSRFFGGVHRLQPYGPAEIMQILFQAAGKMELTLEDQHAKTIADRSRGTPRRALYLLKRVRDVAQVENSKVTDHIITHTFTLLGIDSKGLESADRAYLLTLANTFTGGPTGLKTLAAALQEDEGTLEDVIEPYLMRLGFIEKTTRGRIVTDTGMEHVRDSIDGTL